ncbi:MAG TPA: germination protein YpeB [Symbiobacteriaceae bacterium]
MRVRLMHRSRYWIPLGILVVAGLVLWGLWTWRLTTANRHLALALEAQRQRDFSDLAYHVEQIQGLLGKGLAAGTVPQNMRYMSDVYYHAQAAVKSFISLPLPPEVSATTGKFLQQTGDFAVSVLRNEAAGREMTAEQRQQLARLRTESATLSAQLQNVMAEYQKGNIRWTPPMSFSFASLFTGAGLPGKPATQDQAPASMLPEGWSQITAAMEKLPVMIYDGPFSDHVADRTPAMSGPPVSQEEAEQRMRTYLPNASAYQVAEVVEVNTNLPTYSFRLTPGGQPAGRGTTPFTAVVEVARNGGYLAQFINSRMVGEPTLDLEQAREIGETYLKSVGYSNMKATYGQVEDGTATVAYACEQDGVLIYPDQIKVKVALDNGEILAVDARQYLMSHHRRTLPKPKISAAEAQKRLRPELEVQRVQLALIPDLAGTGEILTYEFLTNLGAETYLVYINAENGAEEQILQQVETDGGTFVL